MAPIPSAVGTASTPGARWKRMMAWLLPRIWRMKSLTSAAVAVPSTVIMGSALLLMPFTGGAWTLLLAALAIGFGNGIGSGLIMTLGADHSPQPGRAHFLGVWRLMVDIGATSGPMLLSFLTATLSLGIGIAATGGLAFGAAWVLGHWIPRLAPPRR